MQINLKKAFVYWHGGYEPKTYGPGPVETPKEVAEAAESCGCLVADKTAAAPKVKVKGK